MNSVKVDVKGVYLSKSEDSDKNSLNLDKRLH